MLVESINYRQLIICLMLIATRRKDSMDILVIFFLFFLFKFDKDYYKDTLKILLEWILIYQWQLIILVFFFFNYYNFY